MKEQFLNEAKNQEQVERKDRLIDFEQQIYSDRPCIYLSIEGSMKDKHLSQVLKILSELPITVFMMESPNFFTGTLQMNNLFIIKKQDVSRFLSLCIGQVSLGDAEVVYQALAQAVPCLLIPQNEQQRICATAVVKQGLGIALPERDFSSKKFRQQLIGLICDEEIHKRAQKIQKEIAEMTFQFHEIET